MDSVVTFRVGEERYALPADVVAECVEVGPFTRNVPTAEGDRLALANVRGRWLPVIELAHALDGVDRLDPDPQSSVLLVLGRDRGQLGLRVQGFDGVVALDSDRGLGRRAREVIEVDGEMVRLVNPDMLVASRAELLGEEGGHMEENHTTPDVLQVVTFGVGGEEFGIDVMKVQRVLRKPEIRVVPKTPEFVEGVVTVGDSIVPVIDMRKRFGVPQKQMKSGRTVLVAAAGSGQVAMVVDDVPGVAKVPENAVSPAPDFFKGLAGKYLEGIVEDQGRLIILLNLDEILSSKERIALRKIQKAAGEKAGHVDRGDKASKKKRTPRAKKKAKP
jgi:purine-binding chemotaxis protein CheW